MTLHWSFVLGAILWLPFLFIFISVIRFGIEPVLPWMAIRDLLFSAVLGLPLALISRGVHSTGHRVVAWMIFGICGLVTYYTVLIGGLIGPVGMLAGAGIGCLPALLVWSGFVWHRRRSGPNHEG